VFLSFKDLTMPILVFVGALGPVVDHEEKHKVLLCKKIQDHYNLCTFELGSSKSTHQYQCLKGSKPLIGGVPLQMKALLIARSCNTKCNSDVFKQDTRTRTVATNDIVMTITYITTIMEVLIVTHFTLKMVIIPI
jgi:hypothetical protein